MRRWSEVERDRLAQLEGVVFDVDDTVTRDGRLERAAFEAMWDLAEAGVHLVAVTGRPLGWADVIARQWPIELAIAENGAGWVWCEDGRTREGYFCTPEERRAQAEGLERVRRRVREEMPGVALAGDQGGRRCDLAFDVGEEQTLTAPEVERLVALIEREGMRCPVSSVHAHVVAGDWDKARGAARAVNEVLGIDLETSRERWLFVGDSGNDAAAFAWFPFTVGVANVDRHLARLPTAPVFVTEEDRGRGFAEIARSIVRSRD